MRSGLVVYKLHFQTLLPGELPFYRLETQGKGDVTLLRPAPLYVTQQEGTATVPIS